MIERLYYSAWTLGFAQFCAFGLSSGCVQVRVSDGGVEDELSCVVAGRTRVECRRQGVGYDRSIKTSLRASASDLRRHGVVLAGRHVCAVSDARGVDCINVFFWTRLQSGPVEKLRDRAFVPWADGMCFETHRDDGFSRFECVQGGSLEERVTFWVPTHHELVSFGRGACVCGTDPESLEVSREQNARGYLGAVCVWGWGEEPLDWEFARTAEERATVLSVRGDYASFDFGDVCQIAREGTADEVVDALSDLTATTGPTGPLG